MYKMIFCPNCGLKIPFESDCKCGVQLTVVEKRKIYSGLQKIEGNEIISSGFNYLAQENLVKLSEYRLDSLYFIASSAEEAYKRKIGYIKDKLIPSIDVWKDEIQNAERVVVGDKIQVYGRIVGITDFFLKEFFGPFSIGAKESKEFLDYSDFGKYKLSELMHDEKLEFSDFESIDFGAVGSSVMKSLEHTLSQGSFNEIMNKREWTSSELKQVKTELGVAVAGEVIKGLGNLIAQNSQAIGNVREADFQLNSKISHIIDVINSLKIEENEIIKQKKLLDTNELILDYCFNKVLKPVVDEL